MSSSFKWFYCPKCAWICISTQSANHKDPCRHCLTEMIYIRDREGRELNFKEKESFIENIIKPNPYYSIEDHKSREDALELERNSVPSSKSVCKCGSTSFSFQPRRWSLLTGVFTGNRQMRVCNGCGSTY